MLSIALASVLLSPLLPGYNGLSSASSASQYVFQEENQDVDIVTGSDFNGLTTFAHVPYLNCLRERSESFDIAILGAPFDTVSRLSS